MPATKAYKNTSPSVGLTEEDQGTCQLKTSKNKLQADL